ncbi:DUF882 domain-containing protein [Flavobacterium sp.]|uniref:YcbK family protein n=1 Tax=Flavobacterium sp. TaxID=239 RepID=UPI002636F2BD|nr:DUF882 domain-containing protein [Flavobacterium sp.]
MMNRRAFTKLMLAAPALTMSSPLFARESNLPTVLWAKRNGNDYKLDFFTKEGYRAVCDLLKDVQANTLAHPDSQLLFALSWMQIWLAQRGHYYPYEILSGLRTPQTNNRTENAARNSFHLPDRNNVFRAVDFRMQHIPSEYMSHLAIYIQQGGVGIYSRDFVHMDTGQITGRSGNRRIWRSY